METRRIPGIAACIAWALGALSFVALASVTPPNLTKALEAQQQLVADRPYDAEAHNDHGNLLVLAGRHEEAGEAYRRSIELAPGGALARYNLGVLLQQTGRTKEAMSEFQGLLEVDARHARAHYQLGMLLQDRKQKNRAVEHYAQAFAYDPELTFAVNNPHIIDNELATEALLISQRYGDAPSAVMPRLYGEPDRIVDLMLEEMDEEEPAAAAEVREAEPDDDGEEERARPVKRAGSRSNVYYEADDADDADDREDSEDEDSEDEDSEDEDSEEEEGGRTLTVSDLETGSSVGMVQQQPRRSGRSSSAGRVTGGTPERSSRSAIRPRNRTSTSRAGTTGVDTSNVGRPSASAKPQSRRAPRYRPASRLSTGRLQLELLPAGETAERDAATATR